MGFIRPEKPVLDLYEAYNINSFLEEKSGVLEQVYCLNIEPVYDIANNDIVGIQLFEDHIEIRNADPNSILRFNYSDVRNVKYGKVSMITEKQHSVLIRALLCGIITYVVSEIFLYSFWASLTALAGAIIGGVSAISPERIATTYTELSMICTSSTGKDYTFRFKCDPLRVENTNFVQVLRQYTF